MPETTLPDYYEILQVSPRAELVTAHDILSDPAQRATYDVRYERVRETHWKIFNQESATSEISNDARIRLAILSLLYVARRNDVSEPGIGIIELERVLNVPENVLEFQMWYLRENGWVERLVSGHIAITAPGVDKLFELGGPYKAGPHLLQPGDTVEEPA